MLELYQYARRLREQSSTAYASRTSGVRARRSRFAVRLSFGYDNTRDYRARGQWLCACVCLCDGFNAVLDGLVLVPTCGYSYAGAGRRLSGARPHAPLVCVCGGGGLCVCVCLFRTVCHVFILHACDTWFSTNCERTILFISASTPVTNKHPSSMHNDRDYKRMFVLWTWNRLIQVYIIVKQMFG